MLATKPEDPAPASTSDVSPIVASAAAPQSSTAPSADASAAPSAPPAEAQSLDEGWDNLAKLVASPEFQQAYFSPMMDPEQYLTSPLPSLGHDFDEPSPKETPLNELLTTPLFNDDSSPFFTDQHDFDMNEPLFDWPAATLYEPVVKAQPVVPPTPSTPALDSLIPFSPDTPLLNDFAPLYPPTTPAVTEPAVEEQPKPPAGRGRRSNATGTRRGITPASLVPLDAPTQSRRYVTPSATSRKEVPAVFARKRARSQAFGDEDDELDGVDKDGEAPPGPNATEKEQIEWKRRQNTLAARKSRKRKLEHQQMLEERVRDLTRERDSWKTRAVMMQALLASHGVPFGGFQD